MHYKLNDDDDDNFLQIDKIQHNSDFCFVCLVFD